MLARGSTGLMRAAPSTLDAWLGDMPRLRRRVPPSTQPTGRRPVVTTSGQTLTPGIPDPLDPARWLVWPWPADANFNGVVRHFLTVYVGRLQGERSTARQLAYWEAHQAALKEAPTHELTGPGAWHWHDDMVRCVDDCVAIFQEKARAEGLDTATNGQRQPATLSSANNCPTCRGRVS